jgi:hypothetical protein
MVVETLEAVRDGAELAVEGMANTVVAEAGATETSSSTESRGRNDDQE